LRHFNATRIAIVIGAAVFMMVTSVPLYAARTDGNIKSSAKRSYVFKTYLKHDAIKIQSKEGIVTLTGTVSDESHRSMAEETILGLAGVKSVDNQLKVTEAPASAGSDAWLAQRVRSTLLFHRSVSYMGTNVDVTDGNVTLRGKASSAAQRELTTEYAKDVSGVKSVDNQMTVKESPEKAPRSKSEKIDDASISSQVRMSMRYHQGDGLSPMKVSTEKGIVTLIGTARNQAEIDLATKRVNDIHGVKSVNNKMTVETSQSSTH